MTTTNHPPCPRCGAPWPAEGNCPACLLHGAHASSMLPGSGAPGFEAPAPEVVDAALPAYEVQILIGQGGMGAVYRARHRHLDRLVAIKVLRPAGLANAAEAAAFAERFEREARVLAKLDHPHIVRIYDFGRSEGPEPFFYLVLEYVEGASLRDLLRDGRLTAKEALEFVPQLCDALQTAHDIGVVHRDVKPENILVDGAGRVRIADFGLAKLRDGEPAALGLTRTDQVFGTPHYMAPEQLRASGAVDHRSDLYSLGVVLYEMLTGELPLGRFAAPSATVSGAEPLDGVVFKALESNPEERYQAASDLRRDVEAQPNVPPRVPALAVTRPEDREGAEVAAQTAAQLSVAPGSAFAVGRTWVAVALLAMAYPVSWIHLRGGTDSHWAWFTEWRGPVTGLEGGISIGIVDMPWYFAFIGLVAAAGLRTMRWKQMPVAEIWPWLLTTLGFALTSLSLTFAVAEPLVDVSAFLERRQLSRLRRPLAACAVDAEQTRTTKTQRRLRRRRERRRSSAR